MLAVLVEEVGAVLVHEETLLVELVHDFFLGFAGLAGLLEVLWLAGLGQLGELLGNAGLVETTLLGGVRWQAGLGGQRLLELIDSHQLRLLLL